MLVSNLDEVIDALKAGNSIENDPDMVGFAGFLYIKEMFDEALKISPDVDIIFNAGSDQVAAQMAMQCFKQVRFNGKKEVKSKLADIANFLDVNLI